MSGINRAILVGHLGADPELKYTDSGQAVLRMRLATSESWKDKNGERKERTEWHTVVMWGKRAESLARHLGKGQQVGIEGRIQTRQWEDKTGAKRYSTEIVATDLHFLGGGKSGGQRDSGGYSGGGGEQGYGGGQSRGGNDWPPDDFGDDPDSEIPF